MKITNMPSFIVDNTLSGATERPEMPYFNWYVKTAEVTLADNVYASKSDIKDPNSGEGLFIENTGDGDNKEEILLRIPKEYTFTEDTIRSLLLRQDLYCDNVSEADTEDYNNRLRSLLSRMHHKLGEGYATETVSLATFFVGFNVYKYKCPDIFFKYLYEVLLHTEVNVPITRPDIFMETYGHYPDLIENEIVIKRIHEALPYYEIDIYRDARKNIRQIYAAVVSRALEIPVEMSTGSDDYYLDITLVPILDFVNHSTANPSCYFDVDRTTKDIILKRSDNQEDHTGKDHQELFIRYFDVVEYTKSTFVYGFIPEIRDDQTAFFNLSLERDFIPPDIRLFYKWFGINPMIQFYKNGQNGEWHVHSDIEEFIDMLLPFMVDSSLEGTDVWSYNNQAFKTLVMLGYSIFDDDSSYIFGMMDKMKAHIGERNEGDTIGLPQLAWTLHFKDESNKLKKRRPTNKQAREYYNNLSETDKIKTYQNFRDFFNDYSMKRLAHLQKSVEDITGPLAVPPYKKDQCESFLNLCYNEIHLLEQMKSTGIDRSIEYNESLEQKQSDYPRIPSAYFWSQGRERPEGNNDSLEGEEEDEMDYISEDLPREEAFTDFFEEEKEIYIAYLKFSHGSPISDWK